MSVHVHTASLRRSADHLVELLGLVEHASTLEERYEAIALRLLNTEIGLFTRRWCQLRELLERAHEATEESRSHPGGDTDHADDATNND